MSVDDAYRSGLIAATEAAQERVCMLQTELSALRLERDALMLLVQDLRGKLDAVGGTMILVADAGVTGGS